MSTNNFEDNKNGIFVIEDYEPLTYTEWLEEQGPVNNDESQNEYEDYVEDESSESLDFAINDTIDNIVAELESKGYETIRVSSYDYKVTGKSITGQIGLRVESGYYANAQVIVTTQRDEQFENANMEEEDITKTLYDFVDEQGFTEYTDDKSDFKNDDEYHLNEVIHNVLWYDDTYEEVLDNMLEDDKTVINVVKEFTTPIKKVGGFSNGEAVYETVK